MGEGDGAACDWQMSDTFPYKASGGHSETESWPLCDGVPQKQSQIPKAVAQRDEVLVCKVQGCKKSVKMSSMRLHVGGHILRRECGHANGVSPCVAEACGFCGIVCHDRSSGVCNVDLRKGSSSHVIVVTSSCPQVYKMSYASVEKGSTANPCTNRPVACPICLSDPGKTRKYVWSYHFLHHMQSVHPAQQLSADDTETFALSVAELKGVIGKEHTSNRRDQKVQKAQDLLRAEAALVDVPALFWSRLVKDEEEGEGP
eukprot:gene9442-biopygen5779